ncbi:TetR family transcriptional regulator, partial [Gaiella sp.]
MSAATRQTAGERRETVLAAALRAFARGGLHGTSTEEIAEAA